MNISLDWLKDYVDIPVDKEELVKRLTMTGLTVENAESVPSPAIGVICGKVLNVNPHPARSDLKVGEITDGRETFTVVSGAPSFESGNIVAYAPPNSKLPGMVMAPKDIFGVMSHGMVVCQNEILLGEAPREGEDIILFPADTKLGVSVNELLGLDDYLLELELTVNYSHCLSVLGVAIECSAIFNTPLKLPSVLEEWGWANARGSFREGHETRGDEDFEIALPDRDLCPRYVGKSVLGISGGYSPIKIERRLLTAGMRPISAVVDATNYVMLETGQPIHAFDRDLIDGATILARRSLPKESIVTLDGVKRKLDAGTLVIADQKGPVAIAGIMGGESTEVHKGTRNVLIETAWFSPSSVRETSKKLKMRTEAAIRFEKKVDPTMQVAVAERAAYLMTKWAGGRAIKGVAQQNLIEEKPKKVRLHSSTLERYLGKTISPDEQKKILTSLRMEILSEDRDNMSVLVPPRRVDIDEEVDLVEEVARYKGYDSFGQSPMPKAIAGGPPDRQFVVRDMIKDFLVRLGGDEVVNTSLIADEDVNFLGWEEDDPRRDMVTLLQPLTSRETSLRASLLPNLLNTMKYNQKQKSRGMFIFETGTVFFKGQGDLPLEFQQLSLGAYGVVENKTYMQEEVLATYYDMKGKVDAFLDLLGIEDVSYMPNAGMPFHPRRSAKIIAGPNAIGELGEVHPAVLRDGDLLGPVTLAWFSLDALLQMAREHVYKQVSRFMPLERDLAIIVSEKVLEHDIEKTIRENAENLERITLFDIYRGDPIPFGMKSLAMRLEYQPLEKTLTEEDLRRDRERILKALFEKYEAKGRE